METGGSITDGGTGTITAGNGLTISAAGGTVESTGTGRILITGATSNAGTITAGNVAAGTSAIVFAGDYSGGTLSGNGTSDPDIEFQGNVSLGTFNHNGDRIVFSSSVDQSFTTNNQTLYDLEKKNNGTLTVNDVLTVIGELLIIGDENTEVNVGGNDFDIETLTFDLDGGSADTLVDNPIFSLDGSQTTRRIGSVDQTAGAIRYNGTNDSGTIFSDDFDDNSANKDYHTLIIDGANRTFTLEKDTTVTRFVDIRQGELNIDGFTLTVGAGPLSGIYIADTLDGTNGGRLEINGDLYIDTGGTFDAGSSYIELTGRWLNEGTFNYGTSTVEFVDENRASAVGGSTTFYNLIVTTPGKYIWFEHWGYAGNEQSVDPGGYVQIQGTDPTEQIYLLSTWILSANETADLLDPYVAINDANYLLSRAELEATGDWKDPPTDPDARRGHPDQAITYDEGAPSDLHDPHWVFTPDSATSADIDYIYIQLGHARIPVFPVNIEYFDPLELDWTYNWRVEIVVYESQAIDSDGDGRIDRIRAVVAKDENDIQINAITLDTDAGGVWKEGLNVSVDGYEVIDYEGPHSGDYPGSFYIILKTEGRDELDTDATPTWRIESNATLRATTASGTVTVVTEGDQTAQDTALPILSYTLSQAETDNEVFVAFSEPVRLQGGGLPTENDFSYDGSATVQAIEYIREENGGVSELLLRLSAPVSAQEVIDQKALRVESVLVDTATGTTVVGGDVEDTEPNRLRWDDFQWDNYAYGDLPKRVIYSDPSTNPTTHRVSDIGLGVIEPVYAINTDIVRDPMREPNIGRITDFHANEWLQAKELRIEAAINGDTGAARIHYDINVADQYLSTDNEGLWLPSFDETLFSGIVPYPKSTGVVSGDDEDGNDTDSIVLHTVQPESGKIEQGTRFEFFYEYPLGQNLFHARCDEPNANDWYRKVRPWSFDMREVKAQTKRVSILNNVIDPRKGEKVDLHYYLDRGGPVTIQVFNLSGDLVNVLERGRQPVGEYALSWDGRNRAGSIVARGIYYIRITAPDIDEFRKVLVVK